MATARWPLQLAIVQALSSGDVTVYDKVPERTAFPYISLGLITEVPADVHNQRGLDCTVTLHFWSDYAGNRQADELFAAADALLDRQPLTVPGWTHVSLALDQSDAVNDPNPDVRHIAARYRVWLTKT